GGRGPADVPGLQRELHAPRMSGELAGVGEDLSLPVPRRRVLRRRHGRRRPAAAAALRTRVAGERRSTAGAAAASSHREAGMSVLRGIGKIPGRTPACLGGGFSPEATVPPSLWPP